MCKAIIFSWKSLLKVLTPYVVPLTMKRVFMLQFLTDGVPLVSHLLKFSLYSRSLPLFQEISFASSRGSFALIVVEGNEIEVVPLILL